MKSFSRLPTTTTVSACGTLLVGILLWASGAFTLIQDWGGHSAPVKVAVLAAAFAIQLTAPRWPGTSVAVMVVLVAVDVPSGLSLPLWISLTDVIFAVMTVGSPRLKQVVGVGCGVVTIGAAAVIAVLVDPRAGVLGGLLGVAFLISPLGYAQSANASVRAARAENSAAEAQRRAALAQERRRVSRELHDTVAGHVSAIAILAEAARDAEAPAPMIASMRTNSLAALTQLREMIDLLGAGPDDQLMGDDTVARDDTVRVRWSSLEPLVTAARAVGSDVTITGDPRVLTIAAETVLTRVTGEALSNAAQHAPGQHIEVCLIVDREVAEVTVVNDVGPKRRTSPVRQGGNGIRNMRIRAESLGGSATIGPEGSRWVVRARVPMGRS